MTGIIVSVGVGFAGCSSTPKLEKRAPASFCRPTPEDEKTARKIIAHKDSWEKKRKARIRAQVQGYVLGEELVHEFDQELDKGTNPEELLKSKLYKKLQALHEVRRYLRHSLEDIYMIKINDQLAAENAQNDPTKRKEIIVEYHGWFTRTVGAEYFIQAAKILETQQNLKFWLIGNTVNYLYPLQLLEKLHPRNLTFFGNIPESSLAQKIAQADISVGHLGDTTKARISISNKILHALASRVAVIAGDYPAIRELLTNKVNCVFVTPSDSHALAETIVMLAKKSKLRRTIAHNGYFLHKQQLTNTILGGKLRNIINYMIGEKTF